VSLVPKLHALTPFSSFIDIGKSEKETIVSLSPEEDDSDREEEEGDGNWLDYVLGDDESYNFDIAINIGSGPPTISWIIQALYDTRHSLCFKLKTPDGAYMLLDASEVMESVLILVNDDADETYFQIEDVEGNILSADSDQVEAHLAYILSMESRKRHVTQGLQSSSGDEGRKRRRFHGPFTSKWRKFSGIVEVRRTT
jgi:hypothetical protein